MKCVKTVGSRASVYHGNAKHTSGGLEKADLKKSRSGSIVSKKNSVRAKRKESPLLKMWRQAVSSVYKQPKYAGKFVAIKKSTPFYNAVKAEYKRRVDNAGLCTRSKAGKDTLVRKVCKMPVKKRVKKCTTRRVKKC